MVLVTAKMGFSLRHARSMCVYMLVTVYTHTLYAHHHTCLCTHGMHIRVGPYTHVPQIYTNIYAQMYEWASTDVYIQVTLNFKHARV